MLRINVYIQAYIHVRKFIKNNFKYLHFFTAYRNIVYIKKTLNRNM